MLLDLIPVLASAVLAQGFDPETYVDPGPNKIVWAPSPHFNDRPAGTVVDTIVLHHTASSNMKGVVKWFASPESRVSAHFTVGKDGSIVQHVNTFYRAWHAGASRLPDGTPNVNNMSVGIEIVNKGDGSEPYTDAQVLAVRLLCGTLVNHRYKGQIKRIISHEHIAVPTGRKNDPLDYPWDSLQDLGVELIFGRPNPPYAASI